MSMGVVAQLFVDGLAMGLVYVLLASGFNLIVDISGVLFIAYGQFYMIGAYALYVLKVMLGVPSLFRLLSRR